MKYVYSSHNEDKPTWKNTQCSRGSPRYPADFENRSSPPITRILCKLWYVGYNYWDRSLCIIIIINFVCSLEGVNWVKIFFCLTIVFFLPIHWKILRLGSGVYLPQCNIGVYLPQCNIGDLNVNGWTEVQTVKLLCPGHDT